MVTTWNKLEKQLDFRTIFASVICQNKSRKIHKVVKQQCGEIKPRESMAVELPY